MGLKPDYRIELDNQDITVRIQQRLISLSISDEVERVSDELTLTLDDRGYAIERPAHGVQLAVFIGYSDTDLSPMGLYSVDEVSMMGPPASLTIRAHAADMRASLKAPKSRSWLNQTIGEIVETIAGEHDLEPKIGAAFAGVMIGNMAQTEEADINFLQRLARRNRAVAKPANGFLLFVKKAEAKTASGRELPAITVEAGEDSRYTATWADRDKFTRVAAYWDNKAEARREPVEVGEGNPRHVIRDPYPTADEAQRAAEATLSALQRGVGTLSLTLPGNPLIGAESPLTLSGYRDGVNGDWLARRVEHILSNQGYLVRIEAQTPEAE